MTTRPTRPTATTAGTQLVIAALTGCRDTLLAAAETSTVSPAARERMASLAGRIATEVDLLQHEWRRPREDHSAPAAGGGG